MSLSQALNQFAQNLGRYQQMWTLNEHMGLTPERFVEYFRNTEPMSLCRNGEMILKEVSHV